MAQTLMTEGAIGSKIIRFAIPLCFGNLFQQLYNTADALIVGNLLGDTALAAVSATSTLIFLLVGFFNGVAIGAGVIISRLFGARDVKQMQSAIHTTLAATLVVGVFLTVAGTGLTPAILRWMGTPPEVMPQAVSYVQIYFAGSIGLVLYNSCMGIMQALGDSRHPLYYLIISSLLNIVLDILLISQFQMDVSGAALATIISQFVSASLCMFRLIRTREDYRVSLRRLHIDKTILRLILRTGLPSGLQNSAIALSNVVVQSHINNFGEMAMSGCGAYFKLEGFALLPIMSFASAITTFVGQNLGAGEYERTRKGVRFGILCSMLVGETAGLLMYFTAPLLISAFTDAPAAIAYGVERTLTITPFFFVLAITQSLAAVLRGAGRAVVPMVTMLVCWCGVRVVSLTILIPVLQSISLVNWIYPITWTLSSIVLLIYYNKPTGFIDSPENQSRQNRINFLEDIRSETEHSVSLLLFYCL